jgi:hypothetical protein
MIEARDCDCDRTRRATNLRFKDVHKTSNGNKGRFYNLRLTSLLDEEFEHRSKQV